MSRGRIGRSIVDNYANVPASETTRGSNGSIGIKGHLCTFERTKTFLKSVRSPELRRKKGRFVEKLALLTMTSMMR